MLTPLKEDVYFTCNKIFGSHLTIISEFYIVRGFIRLIHTDSVSLMSSKLRLKLVSI